MKRDKNSCCQTEPSIHGCDYKILISVKFITISTIDESRKN